MQPSEDMMNNVDISKHMKEENHGRGHPKSMKQKREKHHKDRVTMKDLARTVEVQ
jgi:hypothetical protein